ncbi:MAG: hypothetical protein GY769_25945 [bacterium]|nr:hypothetical protein [bacterium]
MNRHLPLVVMAAVAALFLPEVVVAQCAMCRSAFDSPEGLILAAAFRRGILFLLGVPFAAVGVIAGLIIREQRSGGDEPKP